MVPTSTDARQKRGELDALKGRKVDFAVFDARLNLLCVIELLGDPDGGHQDSVGNAALLQAAGIRRFSWEADSLPSTDQTLRAFAEFSAMPLSTAPATTQLALEQQIDEVEHASLDEGVPTLKDVLPLQQKSYLEERKEPHFHAESTVQTVQRAQQVQQVQQVQHAQQTRPMQQTLQTRPMQQVQQTRPMQQVQQTRPMQQVQPAHAVQQTVQAPPVQPAQPVQHPNATSLTLAVIESLTPDHALKSAYPHVYQRICLFCTEPEHLQRYLNSLSMQDRGVKRAGFGEQALGEIAAVLAANARFVQVKPVKASWNDMFADR